MALSAAPALPLCWKQPVGLSKVAAMTDELGYFIGSG
jgi:hypothetical protein